MKIHKNFKKFFTFLIFLLFPTFASANVIWPTIYIAKGLFSWYIIIAGLIIEFVFIKIFLKETFLKSAIISLSMNAISTVLGIFLIPYFGFFGAIGLEIIGNYITIFSNNTFDTPQWILGYIISVLINVIVEGLSVKIIFKKKFKKMFFWLFAANLLSVLLCISVFGFTMNIFK